MYLKMLWRCVNFRKWSAMKTKMMLKRDRESEDLEESKKKKYKWEDNVKRQRSRIKRYL